eukprot:8754765-Ditylum_brightwellii.AAC.1
MECAYSAPDSLSKYASLKIRGCETVHRPKSSSRGQSLSSLELVGIRWTKNLLKNCCKICQLYLDGLV